MMLTIISLLMISGLDAVGKEESTTRFEIQEKEGRTFMQQIQEFIRNEIELERHLKLSSTLRGDSSTEGVDGSEQTKMQIYIRSHDAQILCMEVTSESTVLDLVQGAKNRFGPGQLSYQGTVISETIPVLLADAGICADAYLQFNPQTVTVNLPDHGPTFEIQACPLKQFIQTLVGKIRSEIPEYQSNAISFFIRLSDRQHAMDYLQTQGVKMPDNMVDKDDLTEMFKDQGGFYGDDISKGMKTQMIRLSFG